VRDGTGERMISLNPASINVPAYKNAGWGSPADIRRTYSPPIPNGAGAEYLAHAPPSKSIGLGEGPLPAAITGVPDRRKSEDTASDGLLAGGLGSRFSNDSADTSEKREVARRRRREGQVHREEDDSSDPSDESEEEESAQAYVYSWNYRDIYHTNMQ
jgi:target of rapamycin complex 2 subunit MAPKAP1